MGEKIRYIIIAKQCEVTGTSSILDGCLKKSFSSVCDLGKRFFGHPSRINDVPCNLKQFCYNVGYTHKFVCDFAPTYTCMHDLCQSKGRSTCYLLSHGHNTYSNRFSHSKTILLIHSSMRQSHPNINAYRRDSFYFCA